MSISEARLSPFVVKSRHTMRQSLEKRFPRSPLVDLTSKGPEPWVKFSPFYPHGGIPVPLSPGRTAQSVEGIWQALKVFETEDIDLSKLDNATMKRLKRTVRRYGRCLGHRAGIGSDALLPYVAARHRIYLPAYRWVLEHRLTAELEQLRALSRETYEKGRGDVPVVLLDYETNTVVDNPARPLSHAGLVMHYLEGRWPEPPRP